MLILERIHIMPNEWFRQDNFGSRDRPPVRAKKNGKKPSGKLPASGRKFRPARRYLFFYRLRNGFCEGINDERKDEKRVQILV
jgi:hypothetical protein